MTVGGSLLGTLFFFFFFFFFLGVVLQVAQSKEVWKSNELIASTVKAVNIPDNILKLRYSSKYHDRIIYNRIGWAISYLTSANFLHRIKRATYIVTDRGKEISAKFGLDVTKMVIFNEPFFKENPGQKGKKGPQEEKHSQELSEQQVQDWVDSSIERVQTYLLDKMTKMDPYKFERLMVQLLSAMGYQRVMMANH